MTYIAKLNNILNTVVKRKKSFSKLDAVSVMYEIDNLVMTQKLSISSAIHLSEASEKLKDARVLLENGKDAQDILDKVIVLLKYALSEAIGGRTGGDTSRN